MFSDDFMTLVTVYSPGTFVPANDNSVSIKHEDRVVRDPFNQQLKSLFDLTQRLPRAFSLSHIAHRRNCTPLLPSVIKQRVGRCEIGTFQFRERRLNYDWWTSG